MYILNISSPLYKTPETYGQTIRIAILMQAVYTIYWIYELNILNMFE